MSNITDNISYTALLQHKKEMDIDLMLNMNKTIFIPKYLIRTGFIGIINSK